LSSSLSMLPQGILVWKIERETKRNAVNYDVMEQLEKAIEVAINDDKVKVLVITGSGNKAFCSGGDLSEFHSLVTEEEAYPMLSKMKNILYKLATLPKPTFAFINGTAIGGGCEIAMACDFRLAVPEAKLGFVQANLAITTGWGGGTLLLERIPLSKASSILTSAQIAKAEEWEKFGLIDYVGDYESFLDIPLMKEKISKEVGVLSAYKKMVVNRLNLMNIQERMELETKECAKLWGAPAHHLAVARFMNKKK
jgi:enoyl-CoA hydratase